MKIRSLLALALATLLTVLPSGAAQKEKRDPKERFLDPGLNLLYRAEKGKAGITPAKAREVLERIHGSRKSKGKIHAKSDNLSLLVKYVGEEDRLLATGFKVGAKIGQIYSGTLSSDRLPELARLQGIHRVESSHPMRAPVADLTGGVEPICTPVLSSIAALAGRFDFDSVPQALAPDDSAGTGVVIGYVDTGVDIFHLDFRRNSDPTKTRIKYLLDLSIPGDIDGDGELDGTGPFGGTLYSESEINAALAAGTFASKDTTGHGTHGLSIAAGDDPILPGLAPAADLIVVKATREADSLGFWGEDIIAALYFIDQKATELGKPYVINRSLGTLFSSHDGHSLEEQAIDTLTGPRIPGKAVVIAAGNSSANSSSEYRHVKGETWVGIPTSHTLVVPTYGAPNPGRGDDRLLVDVWYDGHDEVDIAVTSPNGHTVTAAYGAFADFPTGDGDIFIANMGSTNPGNGDVQAIIVVDDWSGNAPVAGNWTLTLTGSSVQGKAKYDAYLLDESRVGSVTPYFLSSEHGA